MPIYFISLFYFPRKVRLRLEKIQRDFLWGGGALVQRPHLVRWNLVCLEKRKGGLGVRNLALMNRALLSKWNWHYANEREAFWKQVISDKYGVEEGDWCTWAVSGRCGVGLWKAIRNEWLFLNSRLAYQVGSGRRVKFWKDKWCGDEPLCESFPSLFSISLSKDAWVSDVWNPDSDGEGWTLFSQGRLMIGRLRWWSILCSRSKPLGCKGRMKIEWFRRLQRVVISQSSRFILFWSLETLICSLMIVFWRVNVPPKVAFFAWEASWGKTLTLEQLQRRGYSMANSEGNSSWVAWSFCGENL
ncbi:putative ribonuclease H protein [Vitis vinifera]|uniref:Putative ribonuclease H protein n=1 Tax=Vitis vinifera TaxID=29760 RepID=A0A438GYE5_VITVI|nr:putative ribonuclease H protein [Vitis vinifera]